MSESDAPRTRIATGIAGLDEMLGGGFPSGHVVLVTGLPGTGKTCLGLQYLVHGATHGERGVFLSLEEDVGPLLESARQFRWPVDALVKDGTLKVLRIDPKETRQSLHRIQGELGRELTGLKAQRIVVDSVSLLNMLSDDEPSRRQTLFALADACRESAATTVLTAEADPIHPEVSRDGLSEYVADGVILLGYRAGAAGPRVGLALRILKMRRTSHVRTVQPYSIGASGLTVDARAVDFGAP